MCIVTALYYTKCMKVCGSVASSEAKGMHNIRAISESKTVRLELMVYPALEKSLSDGVLVAVAH